MAHTTGSAGRDSRGIHLVRHAPHPRLGDLGLGLWLVGLLVFIGGLTTLFRVTLDYDSLPRDETIPAAAVLIGVGLVLIACGLTAVQLAVRGYGALRRRRAPSRR